jgi:hypothetical protein
VGQRLVRGIDIKTAIGEALQPVGLCHKAFSQSVLHNPIHLVSHWRPVWFWIAHPATQALGRCRITEGVSVTQFDEEIRHGGFQILYSSAFFGSLPSVCQKGGSDIRDLAPGHILKPA